MMLGLSLLHLSIFAVTPEGRFSANLPLKPGLNIIRADNSSGKSTCVNAIAYCLGLEAILGPSRKRPFPRSLYEVIFAAKTDEKQYFVSHSWVSVSIRNTKGVTAIIRRDIQGQDKKIVVESQNQSNEYFLGAAGEVGSAKSERGFHYWLASFIDWTLPSVITFDDKEVPLYLECIFPLFFIEQKRGWSEIQANSPVHYGIRNVKRIATEFCLGIDSFEHERKLNLLRNKKANAEAEWAQVRSAAEGIADFNAVHLKPIPDLGLELEGPYIDFSYPENEVRISILSKERALRRTITALSNEINRHTPNDDRLNALLSTVRRLRTDAEFQSDAIETESISVAETEKKLTTLRDDHNQYLQLRRLKNVGGTVIETIDTDKCPICQSDLFDTLGSRSARRAPMTLDENIEFLKSQIDFFSQIRDKSVRRLESIRRDAKITNNSLNVALGRLNALKEELNEIHGATNGLARERAQAESSLREVVKLKESQSQLNEQASRVFSDWRVASDSLRLLRRDVEADNRGGVVKSLEATMRQSLVAFGFSTSAINDITISPVTLRPEQQGYDIVAETSASDYIRIIWAYTLALLTLAGTDHSVKHGGFVVFDEPRQHEASKVSFIALIHKAAECAKFQGQVIFATSLEEVDLKAACASQEINLICFNDYVLKLEKEARSDNQDSLPSA